jgi:metaxin
MAAIPLPEALRIFFSKFPLQTYPAIERTGDIQPDEPTLWILPPDDPSSSVLSSDVECLKWQAYIALRPRDTSEGDRKGVKVNWNMSPAAGVDGMLPTLCIQRHNPKVNRREWKFLGPKGIAEWIDGPVELREKDNVFRDEMEAWIQLLEGDIHDALVCSKILCRASLDAKTRR